MAYASVNNLVDLELVSKDYIRYRKKKMKLKSKYSEDIFPNYNIARGVSKSKPTEKQIKQYRKYLKEVGDLIFKPGGDYQKFCWDILISKSDKDIQLRKSRGSKYTAKY